MKVKASSKPSVATPAASKKAAPRKAAETRATAKAWGAESSVAASKKKLSTMATNAAVTVAANHEGPAKDAAKHPMLARFGEHLGMGLGVIVTEALALVPKFNKPLLDGAGKPVASIPGADRVGNHDILARHQEVIGPKVTAFVEKMKPGLIHDVLAGLGKGATEAPGASYRLESAISDMFHKR